MKIIVNGQEVPVATPLQIVVQVEGGEEDFPQTHIDIQGGVLNVYRSRTTEVEPGHLKVHLFG
jgi:hypothetical protein